MPHPLAGHYRERVGIRANTREPPFPAHPKNNHPHPPVVKTLLGTTPTPPRSPDPSTTTIADLRKQFGPHFAPGYGDNSTLAELLGRAGVPNLADYLKQHTQK